MRIAKNTYPTIKDLISLPALSGLHISNDGKKTAFVKRTADWNDNTYKNHIWIYEKSKEEPYELIEGTSPLWSPDSSKLAYLRSVDGENQIFVESLDGNIGVQVTEEKEGVSAFKWDPAGKGLFYTALSLESEEIKKSREIYGDFQYAGKEYRNHCLSYIESGENSVAHQLTDGKDFHIHEFDVSSDGKKAVLLAGPSPDMRDYFKRDLYLLDIEAGGLQKLNVDRLLGGGVYFSPDGSKLCYAASIREKEYYKTRIQDSTLEIVDLHTGHRTQPLTEIDSTVVPLRWTSKGILIKWQDKTIVCIGLLSEDGTVEMVSRDGFILDASMTGDGMHLSFIKAMANETFEVYVDGKKITDENSFFGGKIKSNREIISWQSTDGLDIEGVLSTPAGFDGKGKYPLLVLIHGGPAWASFPIHSGCFNDKYPVEVFIEKGFIVLEPNYRGSSGYGNKFLKANYRNLGLGDCQDVISGVDALVTKGIADKDRVGVMGWSQGGFISAFCSIYSDRFKAASVGGGITNWRHHYANTDIPWFIRMHLGNDPWNDQEIYEKTSPMTYIKFACTPTLIQHGEVDARVPVTNSYELYRGLKDMGVETEFVVFKGMAYCSEQPGVNMAVMEQNLEWFLERVLGE
ncbi:S9 family peptidase [Rossellomorea aquimaris]|jgi:dipeptidyl aminopeptidase/acylaminoacyl peptidase|uniref:Peptidase S9 n=1 Tax=Rossellomorea aquimaris TaxID=189382 RepID=A0A1J6W263_9BACI|nr:S9 family peptidase [Rossellomorea aquimaris]OIU71669.1 peptidase S9 [Rossellomorea aquimaris]